MTSGANVVALLKEVSAGVCDGEQNLDVAYRLLGDWLLCQRH